MSVVIDKATMLNLVGAGIVLASVLFMFIPIYRGTLTPAEAFNQMQSMMLLGLGVLGVDVLQKTYKTLAYLKLQVEKNEQKNIPTPTP